MDFDWINTKQMNQALKTLVNNKFLADIKFQFPDGQIIYAHSLILCLRSSKFHGSFKDTIGIIKLIPITDVSHDIFLQFINFLYTDEVITINQDNIAQIFQLALQYSIHVLEELCNESIHNKINTNNACHLYELSDNSTNTQELKVACMNYASKNFLEILNSDTFMEISAETLKAVLELNPVSDPNEIQICQAVAKAAQKACIQNGVEPSGQHIRAILGESVKSIRFPSMSAEEFTNCIKTYPGLLTDAEIISIYTTIANKKANEFGFLNEPRKKCQPINYYHNDDKIIFNFDKIIPVSGTFEFDQIDLAQFQVIFSVSRPIIVNRVCFENLHGINNIVSYISVDDKNVQRDFTELIHKKKTNMSNTEIVPFEFQPRKRYQFEYFSLDMDVNEDITKRTKNKLGDGQIKEIKSNSGEVIFTFYAVHSHVKKFYFKY